jgi:hypothetical protein
MKLQSSKVGRPNKLDYAYKHAIHIHGVQAMEWIDNMLGVLSTPGRWHSCEKCTDFGL